MATWLKQSTSVDVPIGPFLDETDGKTAETGLTITQADIRLKKNNGNWAQKNAAQTLTHEENGWYEVTLDTTDTGTLGILVVAIHESGALPVWREFMVVPANIWDSYMGADLIQADLTQWLGTAPLALASQTVQSSVVAIGANVITATSINADAITAAKIADGAIDAATFAAGAITATAIAADAIGASELAADAIAEIADAVWDEDATAHQTQGTFGQGIGDPAADTDTIYALANSIKSDTAAILADTGTDGVIVASVGTGGIANTSFAAGAIDSAALAADAIGSSELAAGAVDEIWDEAIGDSTITARQALRILAAALAGKVSGAATTTIVFRNVADDADRITATVDADGNRSAVTLSL